ncbi:MAG: hypothetical protein RR505_11760 [Raoultibacter sp.]
MMKTNQEILAECFPETPQGIDNAMKRAFAVIHIEERKAGAYHGRRVVILTLILILLLGAAAYAAQRWNLFDALKLLTGAAPSTADQVMQSDLYKETINNVEIAVKEAGYDGKTLFLQYSYRLLDVDTPFGSGEGLTELGAEAMAPVYEHDVGWWTDHLWIDGQCLDMANTSGSVTNGSSVPGEVIQTEYWRLDNIDVALSGKVEVSLPIGERQATYYIKEHPEYYDANGNMLMPDKGIVTFTVDASDMLSRVRVEHPNVPVKGQNVTAQCSEVCYSPMLTYITLKLEGDPKAIAAYKAENGEGFYSEDGTTMLWEYGGVDVFIDWVNSLALVDGKGELLFPDQSGYNGCGSEWAEFVYPYIENVPEELYLAPMDDGSADMTQAIQVK